MPGPPFSLRSTVPPGTLSSAAALTFAAVVPVRASSRGPPRPPGPCRSPAGRVCADVAPLEDEDEDDDGVVVVAALASAPPPAASAETVAIVVSVLRDGLGIGWFLLIGVAA